MDLIDKTKVNFTHRFEVNFLDFSLMEHVLVKENFGKLQRLFRISP